MVIGGAIVSAIGVIIVGAGLFLKFYYFPILIVNAISEEVQLKNGSEAYNRWEDLPFPLSFKIYFFNVTNPEEIQTGGKPIVNEVGPFVYKQHRNKVNVTSLGSDILTYYDHEFWEFDEVASSPLSEDGEITVLNLPLTAVVTLAEYATGNSLTQMIALNNAIPTLFESPTSMFLRTTPRAFLFDGVHVWCNNTGFVNTVVCALIETLTPNTMPRIEDGTFRFALLAHKNDTSEKELSINSGIQDVSQLGEILTWGNSSTVDAWLNEGTCNDIQGTDSTIHAPFVRPTSDINIFMVDACRSFHMKYGYRTTFSGISAERFIVGEELLASPSTNPNNNCFCLNQTRGIRGSDGCLLDGALELWNCQGAPIVLSLPHFHLAHDAYQTGVEGLNPKEELHQTYVDLEPRTGTPLRGHKRVQFNMFIRPIDRITLTTNLNTTLMPILWIDEGAELGDELIDYLNESLFDVLTILTVVTWAIIGGGSFIFGLGIICMVACRTKPK